MKECIIHLVHAMLFPAASRLPEILGKGGVIQIFGVQIIGPSYEKIAI